MPRIAQDGLFTSPQFDGFGASRFHPDGLLPGGHRIDGSTSRTLKSGVKEQAPKRPGVYAMLDPRGRIIYVGKAKCLRTRLHSYFRTGSRDPKAARIVRQTRTLLWEHAADELGALLRELELIQRHRPRFNVLGLPGLRRYCYVALGRPDAPYAYVTREPSRKEETLYGPFVGRARLEEAVRRLNDHHKLRDCAAGFPMAFAEEKPLFDAERSAGCLRYELGTCLGPCGGGCSRRQYHHSLRKAKEFLDGIDRSLLEKLKADMQEASRELRFERASALRDKLSDLEWLDLRLGLLRRSRYESAYVYPLTASDGRTLWYLLNRGRVWGATWAPTTDDGCARVANTLAAMLKEKAASPVTVTTVDSVLLILAWFRRYPQEKARLRRAEDVAGELSAAAAA